MTKRQARIPIDEDLIDPVDPRIIHPQRVGVSKKGMVSTQHYLATEAAVQIMNQGGNAVDAAVTAAFALSVVEPAASGIGGQTMVLINDVDSGKKIILDGGTRAPHRTIPGELERRRQLRGHQATTVPSTPAVLGYMLKHYGTKSIEEVIAPAIQFAEEGYRISQLQYYMTKYELKHLRAGTARRFFLKNEINPYPIGSIFKQTVLARTLRRLSKKGIEDFYVGGIAEQIHEDMKNHGGLIHKDDLAQIPWPVERRPLSTRFGNLRIFTFGPPGAGRTLTEALNLLDRFPVEKTDPDLPDGALLLAYIIRKANIDRADRPFDPALFAQELKLKEDITHVDYAQRTAKEIRKRIKTHGETTHLSVMDEKGNVVGLTQSIERVYGSFSASAELGFLYNNYMSAFDYKDITHPYYLRPNAVPWASVAPTIIFKGRQPWLVIGSPGSERIVSAILQVILRLRRGATPFDAVLAPRMHCSIDGKVSLEATRMRSDIPELLSKHGFSIDIRDPHSFYLGCVQLVLNEGGEFIGVADPRRDGAAIGPQDN